MLRMKEASIPPHSVFIDHRYLQHTERKRQGKYFLEHNIYLILEEVELNDAIAFAYDNGLRISPKPDVEEGGENSPVVVEINMTYARSRDERCVKVGELSTDD